MDKSQELADALLATGARALEHGAQLIGVKSDLAIVNFGVGVELTLKARLAREHWHLLLDDKNVKPADCWTQLRSGSLKTLGAEQVLTSLLRVLDDEERSTLERSMPTFTALAKLRNKAAHFGIHATDPEHDPAKLAAIALRAWHALERFSRSWPAQLRATGDAAWAATHKALASLDAFLETRATELIPHLKAVVQNGGATGLCLKCDHIGVADATVDADKQLVTVKCQVCHEESLTARGPCPQCGKAILGSIAADNTLFSIRCPVCDHAASVSTLGDIQISTHFMSPKDQSIYQEALCSECWGSPAIELTVSGALHFVCLSCSRVWEGSDDVSACSNCGDLWLGADLEDSSIMGCPSCEDSLRERMERD